MGTTERSKVDLMTIESWATRLGYVVEIHGSLFYVHKEFDTYEFKCQSRSEVVDFILEELRKSCCGEA